MSFVTKHTVVMSKSQTTQTCDRNSSSSMSIRKLRSSSMVGNLTKSWQTWVSESEGQQQQASEPIGWAPPPSVSLGESAVEPKTTWGSRKAASEMTPYPPHPDQAATAASQNLLQAHPIGGSRDTSPRAREWSQNRSTRTEGGVKCETSAVPVPVYKTRLVVNTVSTGAQGKSAGIGFPTERITEEPLSSSEEMLNTRSSPTRHRKCSNTASPLTKSWKQVEKEQRPVEGDEHAEAYKSLETGAGQKDGTRSCVETEHNGSPEEDSSESSSVWVKRPSLPIHKNKDAEEANKINALSKKFSAVGDLKSRWQNWSSEHTVTQKLNPFSEEFDHDYSMSLRLHKGQEGYGRPKEGTMTAERAKRAEQHIHREIDDMCYVIRRMKPPDTDGKTRVTFRELFDTYVRISDKVVGILMRARKHGKVAFEGEMLWQGQDDAVIITLLV